MNNIFQQFFIFEKQVDWWGRNDLKQVCCGYLQHFFHESLFYFCNLEYPQVLIGASEKRKADFLAGRYCARKALAQFGLNDFQVRIGDNRNPLWPIGYHGSISHTSNLATAIVCNDERHAGLGIDIETVIQDDCLNEIKNYVLTGQELCLLKSKIFTMNEVVTIIFSLKESFFKAAYQLTREYLDFDAIRILSIDRASGIVSFSVNETKHDLLRKNTILSGQFRFVEGGMVATLVMLS